MGDDYSSRFYTKVIICILGMGVLFFIAVSYRNYIIKEGKEPYLTVKEILPIVQAFSRQHGMTIYEEEWKALETDRDGYVTVGKVKDLLISFPEIEAEVLTDYKKDNWYIGVADWNRILTELVSVYGKDEIVLSSLVLIGMEHEIKDETGNAIEQTQVLTNQGVFESVYWNVAEYIHSSVTVVCQGSDILSVTGYAKETLRTDNVYLAGVSKEEYHFFLNGYHIRYPKAGEDGIDFIEENGIAFETGELVELSFDKGIITIKQKDTEYINGKLIQISENGFEIEGHGVFEPQEDMAVYRLYGELAAKKSADLRIGYDFTDFVIENGEIAACLMIKDEDMEYIRVLLKNTDYAGRYQETFSAQCDQDYEVIWYENGIEIECDEKSASDIFTVSAEEISGENKRIKLVPKVLSAKICVGSIGRSQGIPSYRGTIEITGNEDGMLVVNEVLLEDYLRNVVPSEMPSSYPKEALMAQAVCARTYAYGKMRKAGLPSLGAHVDDSAGFQVYNNIKEQDSTTEAVRATHNMIAKYQGEPIGTYYYSTSCGVGADASVWHGTGEVPAYLTAQIIAEGSGNSEANELVENRKEGITSQSLSEEKNFREWILNTDETHFEAEEGWYRWTYDVAKPDVSHMEEVLRSRFSNNPAQILTKNENGEFESNEITTLGEIFDIEITKRLPGGVADEMVITGSKAVVKVVSELNIRYVLADGVTKVLRQSGDYVNASSTLPSAFFILELEKEDGIVTGYSLTGGGFGHGVGMSQNGAKNMAKNGMTCEEILGFFYPGVELKTLEFGE